MGGVDLLTSPNDEYTLRFLWCNGKDGSERVNMNIITMIKNNGTCGITERVTVDACLQFYFEMLGFKKEI